MVKDYDGNVTNFGVDVDLDAEIDYEMGGNYSQYDIRVNFDFNELMATSNVFFKPGTTVKEKYLLVKDAIIAFD